MLNADFLGRGNMHAVDVAAIPDGLKDAVGETKDQNILDGFFAQVMIDAINLVLVEDLLELLVKLAGRLEITAERFFDHEPSPAILFLASQPGCSNSLHHGGKVIGRRSQVEKVVPLGISFRVDFFQQFFQPHESLIVIEIA